VLRSSERQRRERENEDNDAYLGNFVSALSLAQLQWRKCEGWE